MPTVSTIDSPVGLAFNAGSLYVANELVDTISKVTSAGVTTTFVSQGLNVPAGMAFDSSGNLYVANLGSNTISKVTPAGVVSTFVTGAL